MFITENYAISKSNDEYIDDIFNTNLFEEWDIVKIYNPALRDAPPRLFRNLTKDSLIWEEKASVKKEMTIKEISEKLGYEVKVIKE